MKNKIFLLFITFLIVHCLFNVENCEGQWVQCNIPNGGTVNSFAVSGNNIFAGTFANGVFLTTNNGLNWSQTGLNNLSVYSFAVVGNNILAGASGGIYISTNNGANWTMCLYNIQAYSFAINGNNIFAGADNYGIYLSTNNGANWTQSGLNNIWIFSLITSANNIFVGTSSNGAYVSTNNGVNWTQTGFNSQTVYSFAANGNNIFAGLYTGAFFSTNNGASWAQTGLGGTVLSLAIRENNIFAGIYNNGFYFSTNNGASWTQKNDGFGTVPSINTILIANDYIFVGTNTYSVWRRSLSEIILGVNKNYSEIPISFSLEQNYPNPFNPSTKISYKVKSYKVIKLVVNDILGKEVTTLLNKAQSPGIYEVIWDGAGFPGGIYFYSLFADGVKIDTKRMVLIK